MVVAQVVRVKNNTLRTFYVQAGDPFYTTVVDGKPCPDGNFEVPPGFDQCVEGLGVPWDRMTFRGLIVSEAGTDEVLRCTVGPMDTADDQPEDANDYLKLCSSSWEPLGKDRWLSLGSRHLWGTIGRLVEVDLTFRDPRAQAASGPGDLSEVVHFQRASNCAPSNTVFLNIFDLASGLWVPNAILCNTAWSTLGAYHAAVEVFGEEWSFYRTPNPASCGVCKSLRPRHHPVHVYRQSMNMGTTSLKDWEVRYLIRGKLAPKWPGGAYDLLNRNCIHFCDELLLVLGVKPVPTWVKGLHETGATILRVPWPLSLFYGSDDSGRKRQLTSGPADGAGSDDEGERSQGPTRSMSTASGARTPRRTHGEARAPWLQAGNPDGGFAEKMGVGDKPEGFVGVDSI